jgi:4,5-dihydroxyphthalate decarboxylase
MSDLPITLTCADYARLMPLATGAVTPEGIALTMLLGRGGSWPDRAEMLRRTLEDPSVQGGEQSMAGHLLRVDKGDRAHVALPLFPLRNFTARDLYVRKDGPIKEAKDLAGKRIGMYGWANSGSIWYRHFLRYLGLDIFTLKWFIGPVDAPRPSSVKMALPEGVLPAPEGRSLSDMLLADELDAVYSPPRPAKFHPVEGPIARLFPDYRGLEQTYFRETGAFPPQHLIVVRREVFDANPWIGKSLTDAFVKSNAMFAAAQRSFPYVSPWLDAELEETAALMGEDFHQDGLEKNRAQMEMFCDMGFSAGLTSRRISVDDYFSEFLEA